MKILFSDSIIHTLNKLCLLLCGLLLATCTDDLPGGEDVPGDGRTRVDVTLQFTVSAGGVAATRGPEAVDPEYTLGTTPLENQLRSITVIVESLNDDGSTLTNPQYDYQTLYLSAGVTSYTTTMKLNTTIGKKHIYIGANMRPEHIEAFVGQSPYTYTGTDATCQSVVSSVMTINADLTGQDILMFAQATQTTATTDGNGSPAPTTSEVIELTATGIDAPTVLDDIKLERVVAKVLLTCKTKEYSDTDVNITDFLGLEAGFCTLNDVYYMLNMTNKKVYVQRTTNSDGFYIDPNYSVMDYIQYNGRNEVFLLNNREEYDNNFMHYDANEMMKIPEPGEDFKPFTVAGTMMQNPEAYDANRLLNENGVAKDGHYTEGIYCLENLVGVPKAFEEAYLRGDETTYDRFADLVSTYMLIAIRYIPKVIYSSIDTQATPLPISSVTDALDALPEITEGEGENKKVIYPKGTYWMYNDGTTKRYLTHNAVQAAISAGNSPTYFQPFIGGYSYYTTYIDGQVNDKGVITYLREGNGGSDYWGVERNHYYILNVSDIVAPGSAVMDNPMRINSVTVEWNDRGSGTVEIKP